MTPDEFEAGIRNALTLPPHEAVMKARELILRVDQQSRLDTDDALDVFPNWVSASPAFQEFCRVYREDIGSGKYEYQHDDWHEIARKIREEYRPQPQKPT